jgi:hypothetical protein
MQTRTVGRIGAEGVIRDPRPRAVRAAIPARCSVPGMNARLWLFGMWDGIIHSVFPVVEVEAADYAFGSYALELWVEINALSPKFQYDVYLDKALGKLANKL